MPNNIVISNGIQITRIAQETAACWKMSERLTEAVDNADFEVIESYMAHLLASLASDRIIWVAAGR